MLNFWRRSSVFASWLCSDHCAFMLMVQVSIINKIILFFIIFFFFSQERKRIVLSYLFWRRKRSCILLLSCVPSVASGKTERSGAEKEAVLSYFLWRRERSKETSTYPKSFPIWKDLTENRGNRRFIRVLVWFAKPVPYGRTMSSLSAGASGFMVSHVTVHFSARLPEN